MTEVKMPQLGESVVEGTVTRWLKKEGDTVEEDELLVEISTDKVDSEVPSTASGVLQEILVQEGDTAKVGDPIAKVGAAEDGDATARSGAEGQEAGEAEPGGQGAEGPDGGASDGEAAEAQAQPEEEASEAQAPEGQAQPEAEEASEGVALGAEEEAEPGEDKGDDAGRGGKSDGAAARNVSDGDGSAQPAREASSQAPSSGDTSKRRIISPLVRRLADEHSVDLDRVEGTGTGGRIRKQDVLRAAEEGGAPAEEQAAPPAAEPAEGAPAAEQAKDARPAGADREELVPWTNIRRRTAEHMVASHLETARAWNAVEVDWTAAVEAREAAKARFKEREGFNLTYMPFLARALCETLLEMPEVNASFDEANKANLVRRYVNLGIAVALEGGGLIVPVIKGADEKNLTGLARAVSDVAQRARSKQLSPDDLTGGTFTITNPGPFGSIISVPIIPRGQAAILGFEAITKRVVVTDDDAIAIRSMGFLTMSWDHRVIDGAEAARFLARLRERIQSADFAADLAQYVQ
jgi:pyruvate dehydrogenase E2 component (dihydrolipoamide acetyltransferase)